MSKAAQKNLDYKKFVVDSRLQYFKPHRTKIEKTFAEEISTSLGGDSKFIMPKFFYDAKGSALFEKICGLSEYYPTRTEISILKDLQDDLSCYIDGNCRLVELGSGASIKTRLLLDVFERFDMPVEYFPIDISDILIGSSEQLLADYDSLHITGIIDTYEGGLEFLKRFDQKRNLIIFLGSSYGNFMPAEGRDFLRKVHSTMKPGDLFLIGLDLVKDKDVLESAYNDSMGMGNKFDLNVLSRINDELDADFDLANFRYHAEYKGDKQRIEMYIRSLVDQSAMISKSNQIVKLKRDELIISGYSYKFDPAQTSRLLEDTGFEILQTWQDDKKYFSLTLASRK